MDKLISSEKLIRDLGGIRDTLPDIFLKNVISLAIECVQIQKEAVIYCKDCEKQSKEWISDKRRKSGGYYVCSCTENGDGFVSHTVDGEDEEFCSNGVRKKDESKTM